MEAWKQAKNRKIKKARGNFRFWVWEIWADNPSIIFALSIPSVFAREREYLLKEWRRWVKEESKQSIFRD